MPRMKIEWLYVVGVITFVINLTTGSQPRILIIGAGPSGIAAASKLYERGFQNVTILEAEGRIGGRVYTTRFDNKWIDLGGQWVYGQERNVVYELAWPHGLLELPNVTETDIEIYNSDGYQIPSSTAKLLTDIFFEAYDTDFTGKNGSVGEYLTEILNTEFEKFPTINQTLKNSFMNLFESMTMISDASDTWWNTSARNYVVFFEQTGFITVNWKEKGYGFLFDLLTKKYPNPTEELPVLNNTHLNTEVVNINFNTTNGKALVKAMNGKVYEADHVIVTTSLGVLKAQHETLFTPQLPGSKVNAINGLEFGIIGKVIFFFDREWWPSNWTTAAFIWDENVKREYENDPAKKWLLSFTDVTTLPHKPGVLVGWVNRPGCPYMETLPIDQLLDQTFDLLKKFLGKSFNIPRPKNILRTNWYSNKHFRGTYSYRNMESERVNASAEDLAAPILVHDFPVVQFAGEATHSHRFGTVDGAVETGLREANRLIDIYKDILN